MLDPQAYPSVSPKRTDPTAGLGSKTDLRGPRCAWKGLDVFRWRDDGECVIRRFPAAAALVSRGDGRSAKREQVREGYRLIAWRQRSRS